MLVSESSRLTIEKLSAALPSAEIKVCNPLTDFPPNIQKSLQGPADLCNFPVEDSELAMIIGLGRTVTYVINHGVETRTKNKLTTPLSDVLLAWQTDREGNDIGWSGIMKPNPLDKFYRSKIPFLGNIVIVEELRRQGHGMRLVSLMHRLSYALWGEPLSAGPESNLSGQGRKLADYFEQMGWLKLVRRADGSVDRIGQK